MKRIIISILSFTVLVTLIFGIFPVVAAGLKGGGIASGDYALKGSSTIMRDYSPLTSQVGEPLVFHISAADPDDDNLIYSASNLPAGATFDPETRTFSWTPGYDQVGVYPGVRFEVSDGELTDFEDITITVLTSEADSFSVSNLRIYPEKVDIGKKVYIRILASNSGAVDGSFEVTLRINGINEDRQVVTLAAGTTKDVKFATSKKIAGTYIVDVNGIFGSFIVTEIDEPRFKGRKYWPRDWKGNW